MIRICNISGVLTIYFKNYLIKKSTIHQRNTQWFISRIDKAMPREIFFDNKSRSNKKRPTIKNAFTKIIHSRVSSETFFETIPLMSNKNCIIIELKKRISGR